MLVSNRTRLFEAYKKDGSAQTGLETGLTGHPESSGNNSRNAKKKRPSFKQLLAKYEEKGATQK